MACSTRAARIISGRYPKMEQLVVKREEEMIVSHIHLFASSFHVLPQMLTA
jgi:hypothetical protein